MSTNTAKAVRCGISVSRVVAVSASWSHLEKAGYALVTVEKDNRGWDLEARKADEFLRIEVEGHVGNVVQFELTPNKYAQLQRFAPTYRVCVVRQALNHGEGEVYFPKRKNGAWVLVGSRGNRIIALSEKVAARAYEAE